MSSITSRSDLPPVGAVNSETAQRIVVPFQDTPLEGDSMSSNVATKGEVPEIKPTDRFTPREKIAVRVLAVLATIGFAASALDQQNQEDILSADTSTTALHNSPLEYDLLTYDQPEYFLTYDYMNPAENTLSEFSAEQQSNSVDSVIRLVETLAESPMVEESGGNDLYIKAVPDIGDYRTGSISYDASSNLLTVRATMPFDSSHYDPSSIHGIEWIVNNVGVTVALPENTSLNYMQDSMSMSDVMIALKENRDELEVRNLFGEYYDAEFEHNGNKSRTSYPFSLNLLTGNEEAGDSTRYPGMQFATVGTWEKDYDQVVITPEPEASVARVNQLFARNVQTLGRNS